MRKIEDEAGYKSNREQNTRNYKALFHRLI